ncbi:hypothetical protein L2Y96_02465 [Luteibacter aegosomaticola]|uniref:hypothetical protein n=1 Tax=Luteibacter aegosomaticola TaxID=2911538 RepID=UPI001FF96A20|nr:hypothetical protein [Luteibacter aegosomaticola]UPG90656.1 hypothetical protein L2Y96_02465 [Luteibacter aegosomaticola]
MSTPFPRKARRCSRLSRTFAALLCISSLVEASAAEPPPPGDVLGSYMVHRARFEGKAIRLSNNATTRVRFLADPTSPTSEIDTSLLRLDGEAWYAARDHMYRDETRMSQAEAASALAWDYGMTKAAHAWEVPRTATWLSVGALAQAHAKKAGLDDDVFLRARITMPGSLVALPASYAVAAMLLREKLAAVRGAPERTVRGLDDGVLRRFLAASGPADVGADDAVYLMAVLEGEMNRWRGGRPSAHNARQLPVMLRLARAAAAYSDDRVDPRASPCVSTTDGRWVSSGTGSGSGEADAGYRPCLVDYTDQDLFRWYRRLYEREMPQHPGAGAHSHLLAAMRLVHPLWVPPLRPWAISAAAHVEVIQHLALRGHALDARSELADDILTRRARKLLMEVPKP